MDIPLLVQSIMGLLVILIIVIAFFAFTFRSKKILEPVVKKKVVVEEDISFKTLRNNIKKQGTTAQKLNKNIDLIIQHYGIIPKKSGSLPHPDFNYYLEVMVLLCRHKNTNKNIVMSYFKQLLKLNPEYKKEINEALTKGLNSR